MSRRHVCIHGHFYQPPRENPWLEAVERQDSALPYHDWNQRVTAECYAPNAASRVLDHRGLIVEIINNYSRISYNFGPTLLSWMEENARFTYEAILDADRASMERFGGHGSAMAQVYGHLIMPLADDRDRDTQVYWGLRDFEHRFGRRPEGMWLAETAADTASLEALAAHGIRFTVLAPHQAAAVRPLPEGWNEGGRDHESGDDGSGDIHWQDVSGGRIDTTLPYLVRLPSGRSITVFFYDGATSRAVAFEELLRSGERLADRILSRMPQDHGHARLVHIATDGETYGHHHVHGEMALSYALDRIDESSDVQLTNYAQHLADHPPRHEARIVEGSSWSCFHGVERWRSDCGCSTGGRPGWNQAWRRPLRNALDALRDRIRPRFEEAAGEYLRDPWRARNDYVEVLLARWAEDSVDAFLERNVRSDRGKGKPGELTTEERVRIRKLMELQRHAMLMFTSCGWFFNDLEGIETVQVLRYAGRAIQLSHELFDVDLDAPFLEILEGAAGNRAPRKTGRQVYHEAVGPSRVDLEAVAAHHALLSLFGARAMDTTPKGGTPDGGTSDGRTSDHRDSDGSDPVDLTTEDRATGDGVSIHCYEARVEEEIRASRGRLRLAVGRGRFSSRVTGEAEGLSFASIHVGGNDLEANVRPFQGADRFRAMALALEDAFGRGDPEEVRRILGQEFEGPGYSLRSLFRDEQQEILDILLRQAVEESETVLTELYRDRESLMRFGADLGVPLPRVFQVAAEFVLDQGIRGSLSAPVPDLDQVEEFLREARKRRVRLDPDEIGYAARHALEVLTDRLADAPDDPDRLWALERGVDLLTSLDFRVDLWGAQNSFHRMVRREMADKREAAEGGDSAAIKWIERVRGIGTQLRVAVP